MDRAPYAADPGSLPNHELFGTGSHAASPTNTLPLRTCRSETDCAPLPGEPTTARASIQKSYVLSAISTAVDPYECATTVVYGWRPARSACNPSMVAAIASRPS